MPTFLDWFCQTLRLLFMSFSFQSHPRKPDMSSPHTLLVDALVIHKISPYARIPFIPTGIIIPAPKLQGRWTVLEFFLHPSPPREFKTLFRFSWVSSKMLATDLSISYTSYYARPTKWYWLIHISNQIIS